MEYLAIFFCGTLVGFGLGMVTAMMTAFRRLHKDLAALEKDLHV
jgi:hypothetical protein